MSNHKILPLAETAIIVAVAYILSQFTIDLAHIYYLEFAVIPLILLALRRGVRWGLVAGLVFGLLLFITGKVEALALGDVPSFLTQTLAVFPKWLRLPILQYSDGILEYLIAPISLAVAGLFHKKLTLSRVVIAAFVAVLFKYFWHFIAGAIFWTSQAHGVNPWWFSLATQGASGLATAVVATTLLAVLFLVVPQLFKIKS